MPVWGNMPTAALATIFALLAFAANSLLARAALGAGQADAVGYTIVRLVSGAIFLWLFLTWRNAGKPGGKLDGSWVSAAALFGYAIFFSVAYLRLGAATGALILFATVQFSMISWGLYKGERPRPLQIAGMAAAIFGIVYLLLPGVGSPDPLGSALMVLSGVAWAVYSLRGRGVSDPVAATAGNFIRSAALCLPLLALGWNSIHLTALGATLALASGIVASGMGYVLWYRALPALDATIAAIVQLTVPIIATAGAILFLGEHMTLRFALASAAVLGGVAVTIVARRRT